MSNLSKVILFIAVSAFSIIIISLVYQKSHPLGGVQIEIQAAQIEKKGEEAADEINIWSGGSNLIPTAELDHNKDLLRQIHSEYGIENGNKFIRENIPVFFWKNSWDTGRLLNLRIGGGPPEEVEDEKHAALKELAMKFDLHGNIIELKANRKDSISFAKLDPENAYKNAVAFIEKFTIIKNITENVEDSLRKNNEFYLINEQIIEQENRLDYKFNFAGRLAHLPQEVNASITLSGNIITEFDINYNIPKEFLDSDTFPAKQILSILLYLAIIILIAVYAYRRIKALEIGFKLSFFIAILVVISFSIELTTYYITEIDWEVLFPFIFGNLIYGGGIFLIWSASESVAREEWKGKFISLDLISNGYLLHSKVGTSILNGLSGAMGVSVIWILLIFLFEKIGLINYPILEDNDLAFFRSISPGISIINHSFYTSIYLISIFFLFTTAVLKRRFQISKTFIIIAALIWAGVYSTFTSPFYGGFLIDFFIGFFLIWFFIKTDVLSSIVLLITFYFVQSASSLFYIDDMGIANSAYLGAGLLLLGAVIAAFSLYTKDRSVDFDAITPAFEKNVTERERLKRELEIARDVQKSFLPNKNPILDFAEIASRCLPAQEVGGDYFDFVKFKDGRIGIIIGDVSGKGTQAAFYMTLTKGFIKAITRTSNSPSEVLIKLNELFYENVERGSFISMIYGIFDPQSKKFKIARAGHNPVILKSVSNDGIINLNPRGLALGLEKGDLFKITIEEFEIDFSEKDIFVFYTDGFTEAMNKKNEEYGEQKFADFIKNNSPLSAGELLEKIFKEVKQFMGRKPQHDDMTLVIVKINEQLLS